MIDTRKKHKLQSIEAYPHNGNFLQEYFLSQRVNRAWLARQLGVAGSTVMQYLQSQSLQLGIWWKISLALKHNFVAELGEKLPVPYTTAREKELEEQVAALQNELSVYKRIVGK